MLTIPYGLSRLELDVPPERLAGHFRGPEALADPVEALRGALESPRGYPALRQALTPDDRVAVVVDEQVPGLPRLLTALLEHVSRAGVQPGAVTLLCPSKRAVRPWLQAVRQAFPGVVLEEHEAGDRRRLSYLAGTAGGRAIYLNRTLVDADQVVVLGGRRFDPVLGHGGAEGSLFPELSDEATRAEVGRAVPADLLGGGPWPALTEAGEVVWLLGAPFFVQLIPAAGDGIAGVLAGAADSCAEGARLLETSWKVRVPRRAETVVASLSGSPDRHRFADLAAAAASAARVVVPGGRIVLLSEAEGELAPGCELVTRANDPAQAVAALEKSAPADGAAALLWARAASEARLSLLSRMDSAVVEGLFAAPLSEAGQARRLVEEGASCLVLEDAHRMLAVVE